MMQNSSVIVHISMLKSGTHLVRDIISQLTGMTFREPEIVPGQNNYEDQKKFFFPSDGYFSWHLFPYESTTKLLIKEKSRCIYLVRNLFDQTLSLYDHFRLNIDAEIGRGRNVTHLFSEITQAEGLKLIIEGCQLDGFEWRGIEHQYLHMKTIFESAAATNGLIVSFEDLVRDKRGVIARIGKYLNVSDYNREDIVKTTSIDVMRDATTNKSHFNRGVVGRIFEPEFSAVHELLEQRSSDYMTFNDYEYLTNFAKLREKVLG